MLCEVLGPVSRYIHDLRSGIIGHRESISIIIVPELPQDHGASASAMALMLKLWFDTPPNTT